MESKYWFTTIKYKWRRIRINWINPIVSFVYWNSSIKRVKRRKKLESSLKRILQTRPMLEKEIAYAQHQAELFRYIKELKGRLKDGGK